MYSFFYKLGGKGVFMGLKTAGFASPAQGYEETAIDLNGLLVKNPPATFFFMKGCQSPQHTISGVSKNPDTQRKSGSSHLCVSC